MQTHEIVSNAIRDQQLLTFKYNDCQRRVEPHLLGLNPSNELTLCAWQVSGTGEGWRDFHVSKMTDLALDDEKFAHAREGYNPNDKTMRSIECQLQASGS